MVGIMAKRFSIIFFLLSSNLLLSVYGGKLVPCYFIFGDSLVDNGNNNDRDTTAKANYPPYGIDFPGGPTGRFTNGRNVADFIAEFLGFTDHIPPFATANGNAVLNGINYASGGAGILPTTGKEFGDLISLDEQLQNHQVTINRITGILGNANAANNHLGQCMYTVGMGSNDYAAYTLSTTRPSPEQYAQLLIDQYSRQLTDLYNYGARKVAVFGLGTIGCVPAALRGGMPESSCLTYTTATSGVFNAKLKSLVDALNKELVGVKFIYINVFGIAETGTNGFKNSDSTCCATSPAGMCYYDAITCNDRADYEYFDGYHPTEATAKIAAMRAFKAQSSSDAYPSDIQTLAQAK